MVAEVSESAFPTSTSFPRSDSVIMDRVWTCVTVIVTADSLRDQAVLSRAMERAIAYLGELGFDRDAAVLEISRMTLQTWSSRQLGKYANC